MYFPQQKTKSKNSDAISCWIFVLFVLLPQDIFADEVADVEEQLNTIIKYRVAAPIKAKKLIRQYTHKVSLLSAEKQLEWHYNTIVVSNQLDDIQLASEAFDAFGTFFAAGQAEEYKRTYLNYLGHFAMKGGYNPAAFQYYLCAVNSENEARYLFSPIYAIASIMMFDGEYSYARELLERLRDLAIRHKNKLWSVEIDNTLGVIALYEKQYVQAGQYFERAMDQHHTSGNRNGETITSINLLLALLLAEDVDGFPGIKSRAKRLINLQKNQDFQRFMMWLELLEENLVLGIYDADKFRKATASLEEMNNAMVAQPVYDFILPKLSDGELRALPEKTVLQKEKTLTTAQLNQYAITANCRISIEGLPYSEHVKDLIEKISKL